MKTETKSYLEAVLITLDRVIFHSGDQISHNAGQDIERAMGYLRSAMEEEDAPPRKELTVGTYEHGVREKSGKIGDVEIDMFYSKSAFGGTASWDEKIRRLGFTGVEFDVVLREHVERENKA